MVGVRRRPIRDFQSGSPSVSGLPSLSPSLIAVTGRQNDHFALSLQVAIAVSAV